MAGHKFSASVGMYSYACMHVCMYRIQIKPQSPRNVEKVSAKPNVVVLISPAAFVGPANLLFVSTLGFAGLHGRHKVLHQVGQVRRDASSTLCSRGSNESTHLA